MRRIGFGALIVVAVVIALSLSGAGGLMRVDQVFDTSAWAAPADNATATPTPVIVKPLSASGRYDEAELEELRQTLLDTVDALEGLYPYAPVGAQTKAVAELPPLVDRELIRSLTLDELYIMSMGLGDDERYQDWKASAKALKSLALEPTVREPKLGPSEASAPAGAAPEGAALEASAPDSVGASAATNAVPPASIGVIPAPTPVDSPPPGIQHANHATTNAQAGDLTDPAYFAACPSERYPNPAVLAVLIASFVSREADDFAEAAGCQGTLFVVCVPFGAGTNVPGCLGWGILKGINLATQAVLEGLNYCLDAIDFVEVAKAWENSELLHAELHMHDAALRDRLNTTDNFLHHFRNQELRGRIEENLASPDDNPVASFALPGTVCANSGYQGFDASNPADQFSSPRLANCGLLEVVREVVDETQDMVVAANGPGSTNNAQAEFTAGEAHYAAGAWREAYDRYRKAYREAVGPSIP